jgi:ribosome biogenesis GTPase / thiamine phosphate phosphatase
MKNNSRILKGLVIQGSRNIMTVRITTEEGIKNIECRIKGKVLKSGEDYYNPIAPGDRVNVEWQKNENTALILSVEDRRNLFRRFNQKESLSQLLAANVDLVLCVCTAICPPFRPRFLDRVLLQADIEGIEAIIICNKTDIEYDDINVDERLEDFKRIGYRVIFASAKTGDGFDELRREIEGKTSVLTGQSGVGKSSIINALKPGINIREGAINEKYGRGVHTTTMSYIVDINDSTRLIDTPGVRLFIPDGIKAEELIFHMREFAPLAGKCSFGLSCSHKTEAGCKIMEAVNAGIIHEDRYESFLRIREDIEGNVSDY